MNLETTYLGLRLRTPLVPSASPLSETMDGLLRLQDAGASAVVLHSLFEEQIRRDQRELFHHLSHATDSFAEATTYFPESAEYLHGTQAYLRHLERARNRLSIPVIASMNGATPHGWTAIARDLERAGASALELNIYSTPSDLSVDGRKVEEDCIQIVLDVREAVTIPLAVKLSPFFSSMAHMAGRVAACGANGLVLFNRFQQPDLDIENLEVLSTATLSRGGASRIALRWIALLHGRIPVNLAATGGIETGVDAIKFLMAGADVTMVCSALMRRGLDHLKRIENEMAEWIATHDYHSVEQLKGALSQRHCPDPSAFERAHYVRAIGAFARQPKARDGQFTEENEDGSGDSRLSRRAPGIAGT